MVLAFSRKMYLEFTLAETLEHFLAAHQHAWEYFGGVARQVWVDNCKVAVLSRATGSIVFNPRYLDFANHYGFKIRACGVGQPQEKGRVENGVGYVKKNFLNGLELSDFQIVNPAARHWLDTVANVGVHGQTHKTPQELFAQEKLLPLHPLPYEAAVLETVRVNSQFRIKVDSNHYSVPCQYASRRLTLKRFPDRLLVYDQEKLVAEHVRRYDRHQDYELPDHVAPLLLHRKKAREQKLFLRFLALSPIAHDYYQQLEQRRLQAARFPVVKTQEQFNWIWPKKINRAQVQNLFRLAFVKDQANVIFMGRTGLGKTHLATALAYEGCLAGHTVLFTTAIDIVNTLAAAQSTNRLKSELKKYLSPSILLIDELGYLPIDKTGADLLFQVFSQRYETGSTVVTTNQTYKNWTKIFNNDATLTSAVLDRVLHHAETVTVEGRSYRMKDQIQEP